jgi:HlyD family secretion protein
VLLANLANALGTLTLVRLAYRISNDLQSALFGEYLRRPYVFHTRNHSTALFNNVVHETTRVINDVMQNVFLLVTNVATALLIVASLILLDPRLAAALIGALTGGYVVIYFAVRNWLLRAGERQSALLVQQARAVHDSLEAIKEIAVLHMQPHFERRFAAISRRLGRAQADTLLVAQSPRHIMECVAALGLVLIALTATPDRSLAARLGPLTFVAFAAYRLLPTMQQAFAAIVRIRAERARFAAIAPDLRRSHASRCSAAPSDDYWQGRPLQEIVLRDVSYTYQSDRPAAVHGVSVCIPAGAVVGLTGVNGSGKTTIADLIAGLLIPDAGQLLVDGVPIDDAHRAAWQGRIGYVPQRISLLDASLACNIALGVAPRAIDRQRLAQACARAQLDELIASLPGGCGHAIGEHGVRLSGGQRQRIGIARALYTGAPVLILDEPTQALDGLTEQEIMSMILRLRGEHTIILIAHRLAWVRGCDRIYELEAGRIAASGSYPELLRASDRFRRLARLS